MKQLISKVGKTEDSQEQRGEDILKADISELQNERLSDQAPAAETLPDEPALACDDLVLTNRQLCDEAEGLRRRIGWHAGDCLLICQKHKGTVLLCSSPQESRLLVFLTAAFACGSPVVILSETEAGEIWDTAKKEKSTLISLDDATLGQTLEDPCHPGRRPHEHV